MADVLLEDSSPVAVTTPASDAACDDAERRRSEEALRKRVKELQCLYALSTLLQTPNLSLDEILQGAVDLLPPAWQWPERACARVTVDGREFRSANFAESDVRQSAIVAADGVPAGAVEVFYRGREAGAADPVFLREEGDLIASVGENLGRAVARHRTARALEVREAEFRGVVENVNAVVYSLVVDGAEADRIRFSFMSRKVREFLGCDPEEVIADPSILRAALHPEDRFRVIREWMEMVSSGRHLQRSYRLRPKGSDEYRWIEDHQSVIRGRDGSPIAICGVAFDVTERRRREEESRLLREQLLHAQKMESLGTLAGGIAHDFNNLLMGIMGNLSLIRMRHAESVFPLEWLDEIEGCVQSAAGLTRQILGFARRGRYEVKPVDLVTVAENQAALLQRSYKRVAVRSQHPPGLWHVMADRGQIEQVLLNLLLNAVEAMAEGGVLGVETKNMEVNGVAADLLDVPVGRFVRLSVTDTGTGMDRETQERIFEPFFTTKGLGRGTGLGLATVFGILRNHGGAVTVDSELGRGTTFDVYLPACAEEVEKASGTGPDLRRGGETVLVVDDEEPVRRVCAAILAALGYDVLVAGGGPEALEMLRQPPRPIGLVLLDMVMPQMNGRQTLAALRRIEPSLKVLLCSGYGPEAEMEDLLRDRRVGFLHKPFSVEQLSEKLRQVLDGRADDDATRAVGGRTAG